MGLKGKGKRAIQAFVDGGVEFKHTTLMGVDYHAGEHVHTGQLPQSHSDAFRSELAQYGMRVLFSYQTPIAWLSTRTGEWTVPDVRYSVTTTNHQNVVATAIANPGFYENARW